MNDVTAKLTVLPSPFKTSGLYAQNVWDMQLFNGKIYIGQGNSNNSGPGTLNAGPIPINSLDPVTNTFTNEFTVTEEQIDIFRIINGKLTIPGHDSREGWDLGNYYTLESTGWKKNRTIPSGIHVYDIIGYEGKLFAALGTDGTKPTIVMSADNGVTWTGAFALEKGNARTFTLFIFEDNLYAVAALFNYSRSSAAIDTTSMLKKWDGKTFVPVSNLCGAGVMLPNTPPYPYKIVRATPCMGKLLYISGMGIIDHDWVGQYAHVLHTMQPQALNITTPLKDVMSKMPTWDDLLVHPADFLDRGAKAYMLSYQRGTNKIYTNIVSVSTDCITWTEVFRFTSDALARSFEELNGTFYFGMGCNPDFDAVTKAYVLPKSTGSIIVVKP